MRIVLRQPYGIPFQPTSHGFLCHTDDCEDTDFSVYYMKNGQS